MNKNLKLAAITLAIVVLLGSLLIYVAKTHHWAAVDQQQGGKP